MSVRKSRPRPGSLFHGVLLTGSLVAGFPILFTSPLAATLADGPDNSAATYVARLEPWQDSPGTEALADPERLLMELSSRHPIPARPAPGPYTWSVQPFRATDPLTRTFLSDRHRPYLERSQGRHPHALKIDSGSVNLDTLAQDTPAELIEILETGVVQIKIPLVIGADATLVVQDIDVELSTSAGAFIVNGGRLYVDSASFTGLRNGEPAVFERSEDFRPFLISWGGSRTFAADSRFAHLGFQQHKAYGISVSQFHGLPPDSEVAPPVSWFENNVLEGMYFGFYTYEASTTVLSSNTFRDCIVYGIDPHDRSEDLWIVGNEVSGTRQKHGIILSREVNDAHIIGNYSHHNRGSGIMLDRASLRARLIGNHTLDNQGDGLSVYESDGAMVIDHVAANNRKHGIYVRNSSDVSVVDSTLSGNGKFGVAGASFVLDRASDGHRDPYEARHSFGVYNTTLTANRSGMISARSADRVALHRVHFPHQKLRLGGDLSALTVQLGRTIATRRQSVTVVEPRMDQ